MTTAQRNILTILTTDCLIEIFWHFRNDLCTLHSCALSNKIFCKLAMPSLWHNPFAFTHQKIDNMVIIIRTYLCLTDMDHYTKFQLNIHELPRPFFEYHEFLREFELNSFQEALREFVRRVIKLKTSNNVCKKINKIIKPLNEQLGNLLLSKNNNFNHLNFHYTDICGQENQLNICSLNDIDDIILNINKLSLGFSTSKDYSESFLEIVTTKKRNLQHLRISSIYNNHDIYNAIIKLLQSQQYLETLETSVFWASGNMTSTFKVFRNFSHSLISLKITNRLKCITLFSLLDILRNLRNLEVFSLNFQLDDENFLNSSIPSNQHYLLERLDFIDPSSHFRNPLYNLVCERVRTMSINVIISEIRLSQQNNQTFR